MIIDDDFYVGWFLSAELVGFWTICSDSMWFGLSTENLIAS